MPGSGPAPETRTRVGYGRVSTVEAAGGRPDRRPAVDGDKAGEGTGQLPPGRRAAGPGHPAGGPRGTRPDRAGAGRSPPGRRRSGTA